MTQRALFDLPAAALDPEYTALAQSFRLSLLARNRSGRTIITYLDGVRLLGQFLACMGMPTRVGHITREHIEACMAELLGRYQPATVRTHFAALRAWFHWLEEEGEISSSPMARMSPPHVPESPPAVLTSEQVTRILSQCSGPSFLDRRDTALIRLLIDTGMRRGELAGLHVDAVDLEAGVAQVTGKGSRTRWCAFGRKTGAALDRYLRTRARHPFRDLPDLWLTQKGALSDSGVYTIVRARARAAGLEHVYVHLFRHTYAHLYMARGGQETNLMQNAGWRSRTMLQRYGASALAERARDEARRLGIGDSI